MVCVTTYVWQVKSPLGIRGCGQVVMFVRHVNCLASHGAWGACGAWLSPCTFEGAHSGAQQRSDACNVLIGIEVMKAVESVFTSK